MVPPTTVHRSMSTVRTLVGIYGGTLEVFRNMMAQHVLGLGKPSYSPPVQR